MPAEKPTEIETLDVARILDGDEDEWKAGYLTAYRRLKTVEFLDDVVFNDSQTSYTSDQFLSAPYSKFLLMVYLRVSGAPTDILIEVEMKGESGVWHKYMSGPFGDLRYEDAAGTKKECIDGEVRSHYFRVKVTATGTDAANTFTLDIRANFASI